MIESHQAKLIIHCGDLVAPFVLKELAQFYGPVHWVLGNNDGDPYMLTKISLVELKNMVTVHGFRVQRFWVHLKPACHSCPQYGRPASGRSELLIREF